jgi:hypothetical protein
VDSKAPSAFRCGHRLCKHCRGCRHWRDRGLSRGIAPRPVDRNAPLQLQQIAALEIDEQQRGTRVAQQIAERIEITVARIVGPRTRRAQRL